MFLLSKESKERKSIAEESIFCRVGKQKCLPATWLESSSKKKIVPGITFYLVKSASTMTNYAFIM